MNTNAAAAGLSAIDLTLWRGPNCLFEELSFDAEAGSLLVVRGPKPA